MPATKPLHDKDVRRRLRRGQPEAQRQAGARLRTAAGTEADQDLGREQNQQKFLATLANQTATPPTVLNPFKLYPVIGSGLDTLTVDKHMHLWDLVRCSGR